MTDSGNEVSAQPLGKILIVRLGSLGDIIHALPAAAALREAFPRARIDWIVDVRHKEILDLVPVIDRRLVLGGEPGVIERTGGSALERRPAGLVENLRQLRREHYDVAIDMQGLVKSAVLARGSGAQRVVGFRTPHLRERLARAFYTEVHDPRAGSANRHVIYKNLGLVEALGVPRAEPRFPLERPASTVPATVRARLRIGARDPFVAINPGAAWPNKRWPAERLGLIARFVHERYGVKSVVLWGPGEETLAQAVAESSTNTAKVAPATSIGDLVALLADASLLLSGDTGPLHIGAAVGTPIVGIYGPTDAARNGPWADDDECVSVFEACQCHHQQRCRVSHWCLLDVSPDTVLRAVDRRMSKVRLA